MGGTILSKRDLIRRLQINRQQLRELGVRRLGLFGSFVRQQQKPDSDVDLLVEFEQGKKNFDNFMSLSYLLEELLECRVELVTTEALSPHIGPHIIEETEYVLQPS